MEKVALDKKQEEERKAKEDEDRKQQEEEKKQAELKKIKEAKVLNSAKSIKDYYKNTSIVDFFVASNNSGQDINPLVALGAFFNEKSGQLDLHYIGFEYTDEYIRDFMDRPELKNILKKDKKRLEKELVYAKEDF